MERERVRATRRSIAAAVMVAAGLTAFVVGATSGVSSADEATAPGQCPEGYEKALESAGSDGSFATFTDRGELLDVRPVHGRLVVDVPERRRRERRGRIEPQHRRLRPAGGQRVGGVAAQPGRNQASISNICARFGALGETTTTTVAGDPPTTTTGAEVLGEVERARGAPEELAFTGSRIDPLWLAVAGLGLMLAGAGLHGSQRAPARRRSE